MIKVAEMHKQDQNTLYDWYCPNSKEIKTGLQAESPDFLLNGKPIQILSGSLHYFRILPGRWRESIRKMRNCKLNTVCSYIPWNLHEDIPGNFNFEGRLDLRSFIKIVQEEDMFLILRPGPYICAELDLGGLPSWLLRDPFMKLRSNYPPFLAAVEKFFTVLINLIKDLQFSKSGGPIIAVQVENEFASYGNTRTNPDDYEYISFLKDLLIKLGISELLFTCDMPSVGLLNGSIDGILMSANFQTSAENELDILKSNQPNKPLMVAEFWSGWFNHWGEDPQKIPVEIYTKSLETILKRRASFNIYVFQGGTNFGFLNGANISFPTPDHTYCSTITSYDYDAPLTESGEATEKYYATSFYIELLKCKFFERNTITEFSQNDYLALEDIEVKHFLPLSQMLLHSKKIECVDPVPMEMLNVGENYGQRFGFTLYTTKFNESGLLKFYITRGTRVIIIVNNQVVKSEDLVQDPHFEEFYLNHDLTKNPNDLQILVENLGRINFTENPDVLNKEIRGICGRVTLNYNHLKDWAIYPLDFDQNFVEKILKTKWLDVKEPYVNYSLGLFKASFVLEKIQDTYLYSKSWDKGIVFINNFNIGRYWVKGPQQTLYVPSELFHEGSNLIWAFELQSTIHSFDCKKEPLVKLNNN